MQGRGLWLRHRGQINESEEKDTRRGGLGIVDRTCTFEFVKLRTMSQSGDRSGSGIGSKFTQQFSSDVLPKLRKRQFCSLATGCRAGRELGGLMLSTDFALF